ncbi:PUA domain-containing protein [Archaeoglobus veneficus]|uniref:PUA domain containing protein n=1 Tax=Archaeoglobus veneficus (strain DSM 11195 / SNP6) TaxID=693661 RepID=F2KT07_ARCVS|nr:PUA domain-containing protein [Archaeoglobus veneficus]AEA47037.1 PUA domain containing protein [Archaeoglobus veneficus SNP6]
MGGRDNEDVSSVGAFTNALRLVRVIADYQFGRGAGKALFPETCSFILSSTGRVRQVVDGVRIATVKPDSGLLTISIEGARRLHKTFPYPKLRVCVRNDVSEFIAKGKSVFAKHVVDVDEKIRPNDEVIVVNEKDELLATGKAILAAKEMLEMKRGVAVSVRQGVLKSME